MYLAAHLPHSDGEALCIMPVLFDPCRIRGFGSLCLSSRNADTMYQFCISSGTIWGEAIRVDRVVVVDIAARVDVPRIARIAAIRTAQTNILSIAYTPATLCVVAFFIGFLPSFNAFSDVDRVSAPVFNSFCFEMEQALCNLHKCKQSVAVPDRLILQVFSLKSFFWRCFLCYSDLVRVPAAYKNHCCCIDNAIGYRALILWQKNLLICTYLDCIAG